MALNIDINGSFLIADCTFCAYGFNMQSIFTTGQILESHTVSQSITIAPVFILAFHPVHELQTLTLVIVSCSKFNRKGVLLMS